MKSSPLKRMSLSEKLKTDFENNFGARFRKRPRFFVCLYAFLGSLGAFAAGLDLKRYSSFALVDFAGAFVFWLLVFWGTGILARKQKEADS
jgi:hypothetical protein